MEIILATSRAKETKGLADHLRVPSGKLNPPGGNQWASITEADDHTNKGSTPLLLSHPVVGYAASCSNSLCLSQVQCIFPSGVIWQDFPHLFDMDFSLLILLSAILRPGRLYGGNGNYIRPYGKQEKGVRDPMPHTSTHADPAPAC